MMACRGCGVAVFDRVLDLGSMPAADFFPPVGSPVTPAESAHRLTMALCRECGLAQLVDDDTAPEEPRGVEPEALRTQACTAVRAVADAGYLTGDTVTEFGSPHGGTWLPLLTARGFRVATDRRTASVVIDCFGIMHEPDQRAAFSVRAAALDADGVLLIQFHSLTAIVKHQQWTALRHGHFAYYSLTSLRRLLADSGLHLTHAWLFDLYGGTVLAAARRSPCAPPTPRVHRILVDERMAGVTNPVTVQSLQLAADTNAAAFRDWLTAMAQRHCRVFAYGAASRAVPLFAHAGVDRGLVAAVADASTAKQGRRMPGTDVPIISPEQLLRAHPDKVVLTLPDLLPEVSQRYPELSGRWVLPSETPRVPAPPLIRARSREHLAPRHRETYADTPTTRGGRLDSRSAASNRDEVQP
ncbi:transferase [Rhodococcus opacus]|uniref:transferase n=1 Tax=Rhodococcus opacus TaxID=37919 RepID=UPI0002EEC0DA|nr:transferase [Rhodococcus opacus]MDX5963256.1 transferase [Rhodococcus opacus]NKY70352.1 class I SAM-dependent methyltransferase [Rhodococcus opacus]CAG7602869.1 hypothetical protein E143388_05105 [Rhodococcus opacus]